MLSDSAANGVSAAAARPSTAGDFPPAYAKGLSLAFSSETQKHQGERKNEQKPLG
jgi:hypothetical protein